MRPHIPFDIWTGMASTASSRHNLTSNNEVHKYNMPAIDPVITAAQGSTTAQPPVIATRPARQPFTHFMRSYVASPVYRSVTIKLMKRDVTAPEAAASVVFTAASDVIFAFD
eukprot:CAMPEP_0197842808 /NCGR_PEP_ID=MMETSP1437-20131217/46954_1 /TAXON_ID=49252 ORGANISM="Eucampia antarctica, Strain CCMP1452" /NCGR_SAMPLE_ID=MMETSP1437 /ASSEMBLY_ACC=CAM_ASM_001096 /LENGTH=111 /DNA_ID=CAMNT_0043452745 /DNA_START=845 /DNA_END=1180 /DNA_ORIENTATION=+